MKKSSLPIFFFILLIMVLVTSSECSALKRMVPETTKDSIVEKYLQDRQLDPIEGIWYLPDEEGKYLEVIIMKNTSTEHHAEWAYAGVLSDPTNNFGKVGEAKILFNKTETPGFYKGLYVSQYRMGLAGPKGQFEIKTNFTMVQNNMMQAKLPRFGYKDLVTIMRIDNFAGSSSGIGFFVTNDLVATNAHVVEGKSKITIVYGTQSVPATIVATDSANDIALLKASGMEQLIAPLMLGNPLSSNIGDAISVPGLKTDEGVIEGYKGRSPDLKALLQINTPINPGNSGGPLLNMNGQVIGVVSSNFNETSAVKDKEGIYQSKYYAAKISYLMDISPVPLAYLKNIANAVEPLTNDEIKKKAMKAVVCIQAEN